MDASIVRGRVLRGQYRDSMVLMYLSAKLGKNPGVLKAAALMGTAANKSLLSVMNLASPEADDAGPNDLVVLVRAASADAASAALARLEEMLAERVSVPETGETFFHSIETAAQALPGANLAVISVPGIHAAREARKALELGLHVFLFSDNVPLTEEVALKQWARDRGLLVMGPDCGTSLIGGFAVGFANVVRRGRVGIVGAAGTGIQEVSILLDRAGLGISHALGTGGRDLTAEVGGITTMQAIEWLGRDPETEILVMVSKLPAPRVIAPVLDILKRFRKPVVACFLGRSTEGQDGNIHFTPTLADAALEAARLMGYEKESVARPGEEHFQQAARERSLLRPGQKFLRGLFSGGSLCLEAMILWREAIGPVWSNVPLEPAFALPDRSLSVQHAAVDLGDDFFTAGCPHPMIDPTKRKERILREAEDPTAAVIVLDFVMGHGAHPDMAGALLPAIREARRKAQEAGRHLAVVAHVLGTEGDPQSLEAQENQLRSAGVLLAPSNAAAARLAALIVEGEQELPWREGLLPDHSLFR